MKNKKIMWGTLIFLFILTIGMLGIKYGNSLPPKIYEILTHFEDGEHTYISQVDYALHMEEVVEPYLQSLQSEHIMLTADDHEIYYRSYLLPEPKGTVVISHGFSEWIEKYNELIYYFTQEGYSVYVPSHRGHGISTRAVDDLSMVHIDDFDNYVDDLASLIQNIVMPSLNEEPLILFGHSMGGGISTLLLERYPNLVDLAILSSPMMEVLLPGVPNFLGHMVATAADLLGQGAKYVFTHGPFEPIPQFESSSTQAEERYMYYFNKRASHDYYQTEGGSFSWLKEAISATSSMARDAHLIDIPVLLFQAEHDELVKPGAQNHFVKKAPAAEMVFVPGAKHDLYFEKDSILFAYLDRIFDFLDTHID